MIRTLGGVVARQRLEKTLLRSRRRVFFRESIDFTGFLAKMNNIQEWSVMFRPQGESLQSPANAAGLKDPHNFQH
jgi:hypothetical protein